MSPLSFLSFSFSLGCVYFSLFIFGPSFMSLSLSICILYVSVSLIILMYLYLFLFLSHILVSVFLLFSLSQPRVLSIFSLTLLLFALLYIQYVFFLYLSLFMLLIYVSFLVFLFLSFPYRYDSLVFFAPSICLFFCHSLNFSVARSLSIVSLSVFLLLCLCLPHLLHTLSNISLSVTCNGCFLLS